MSLGQDHETRNTSEGSDIEARELDREESFVIITSGKRLDLILGKSFVHLIVKISIVVSFSFRGLPFSPRTNPAEFTSTEM